MNRPKFPRSFAMSILATLALSAAACSSADGPSGGSQGGSEGLPDQEVVASPPAGAGTKTPVSVDAGSAEKPEQAPPGDEPVVEYRLPTWQREDVQPKSARFGQTYGLESYRGRTIVVVLLEGFCPYCQSNSLVAEQLQSKFDAESLDIQIVILGDPNATQFAKRVSLPIFRDGSGEAWQEMRTGASKHDSFVFGPDGKRSFFWPGSYQGDASGWTEEIGAAARAVAKAR